jgi:hypothetical protein
MYRRFGARVNTREKLNLSDKGLLFVCAGYLCKADVTERSVRSADARPFPNASGNMEHVYAHANGNFSYLPIVDVRRRTTMLADAALSM